ncbi:MAG: rRNA maturation RNase YbeY [Bacteroidales bacterium]|nr:rRNA maturation RNase YbeY [Bacteroidales bacterium]HPS95671.1 rRNA maturation RNase YbeY [Bacteroidales bacterium]
MVKYFREDTRFVFKGRRDNNEWIKGVIASESDNVKLRSGDINIIFCSDEYLLELNKKYLSHDFYTDIITFDNCSNQIISGDLFISIDRVRENSKTYSSSFDEELHRVIVHGLLHLLGYKDKTKAQSKVMREKESFYLNLRY